SLVRVMRAFGQYLMDGRLQAIFSISLLSLIAMFMTPMAYLLSGTPVGLISLRRGPVIALQVTLGTLLVILVFLTMFGLSTKIAMAFVMGIWLPVWFSSVVLRNTESQGVMILATGLVGLVYVIVTYVMFGDVQAMWRSVLFTWLENAMPTAKADQIRPVLEQVIPYMNAAMASGIVTSIALTVMLARWWQSWIYHPGGFRQEFISLRLPRALLVVVLVSCVLIMLGETGITPVIKDALFLTLFLYVFHGVSVVHGIVAVKKLSRWWLFAMYFGLIFFSLQAILFVACIGLSDSLFQLSANRNKTDSNGPDKQDPDSNRE
ncbi:MAG: YybS family protein, partial [Thiotrichales bacterium]|nr:YybS family protein [Thiotrichales bacterium]